MVHNRDDVLFVVLFLFGTGVAVSYVPNARLTSVDETQDIHLALRIE